MAAAKAVAEAAVEGCTKRCSSRPWQRRHKTRSTQPLRTFPVLGRAAIQGLLLVKFNVWLKQGLEMRAEHGRTHTSRQIVAPSNVRCAKGPKTGLLSSAAARRLLSACAAGWTASLSEVRPACAKYKLVTVRWRHNRRHTAENEWRDRSCIMSVLIRSRKKRLEAI